MESIIKPNLNAKSVPRTKTAHQSRIYYEDGRSWAEANVDGWATTQCLPPVGEHSFMYPIIHRHSSQNEYFEVVSGDGMWTLHRGGWLSDRVQKIHLKKGDKLTIPQWAAHKFENTSKTDNLVIRAYYDPDDLYMEERFFRNAFGYFDDCRKAGVDASLFQAARFGLDMKLTLCFSPGPEWIAKWVDFGASWVFGRLVGDWILGYPASYPEYFDDPKAK